MAKNMFEVIEQQELLQKLIDAGHGDFVDKILMNETKAFTRGGKMNRSGTCRVLDMKPKQLEEILVSCREILASES